MTESKYPRPDVKFTAEERSNLLGELDTTWLILVSLGYKTLFTVVKVNKPLNKVVQLLPQWKRLLVLRSSDFINGVYLTRGNYSAFVASNWFFFRPEIEFNAWSQLRKYAEMRVKSYQEGHRNGWLPSRVSSGRSIPMAFDHDYFCRYSFEQETRSLGKEGALWVQFVRAHIPFIYQFMGKNPTTIMEWGTSTFIIHNPTHKEQIPSFQTTTIVILDCRIPADRAGMEHHCVLREPWKELDIINYVQHLKGFESTRNIMGRVVGRCGGNVITSMGHFY